MIRIAITFILATAALLTLRAQTWDPPPAFAGQTDAPAPSKPSPPFDARVVAKDLNGAWAMAFLPDGNILVTQNAGTMRIVSRDGMVSAPLAGVPAVKSVAAQGLHDVLLRDDFVPGAGAPLAVQGLTHKRLISFS